MAGKAVRVVSSSFPAPRRPSAQHASRRIDPGSGRSRVDPYSQTSMGVELRGLAQGIRGLLEGDAIQGMRSMAPLPRTHTHATAQKRA
jgi:hypothetical protein